jgi:Domain of unknown function (DUF5666)
MTWTRLNDLMGRQTSQDQAMPSDRIDADQLDAELVDDDYIPKSPQRLGIWTGLLLGALVCSCAFLGGVEIQKHHDSGVTSPFGPVASLSGGGGGFPAGGLFGGTGTGTAATGSATTGTGADPSALAVVGAVTKISPANLTVTDLGGTTHTVLITGKTTITTTYRTSVKPLAVGDIVSVAGTTAANGSVTASAVTVR